MTHETHLPDRPFTATSARPLGINAKDLEGLVAAGVVRRVLTGAYVATDLPDSVELRAAAARLVLSRHVVLCDRTAAWIWGVDTFAFRELEILPPLETYALRGHGRTRRPECVGGIRDLRDDDLVTVGELLVTTPVRTAVDLACKLPPRDGLAALDGFARTHGISRAELRRLLVRFYRRRGVVRARQLVAWADARSESPGESRTRYEILRAGLPSPELQHWVLVGGKPVYRLDLAYPRHRIAVEFDGREFHESDEHRERDVRRRAWLTERGWTVIVVTKDDFTLDAVEGWISTLRSALRVAA